MRPLPKILFLLTAIIAITLPAQAQVPPSTDLRIYDIVKAASPERIEKDIRKLVSFGTRNTLSDTLSDTRGIGAARRWIKSEFENISAAQGSKLEIFYQYNLVEGRENSRIKEDTWVVNVVAIQRGTIHPNRAMSSCPVTSTPELRTARTAQPMHPVPMTTHQAWPASWKPLA